MSAARRMVVAGLDGVSAALLDHALDRALNGEELWADEVQYWNEDNWVYSTEEPQMRRTTVRAPIPVAADELTCGGTRSRALVIDGWSAGQSQQDTFRKDAVDMTETLNIAGFDTSTFGPKGEMGYDGTSDRASLGAWFTTQAAQMKAGETLFVFLSGHGAVINNKTVVGPVWEADLAGWLSKFDAGVEVIVVLNGCHSGGMLDSLTCSADYAVAATSEQLPSYGDLDAGETINPRDKGSEFVSSICGAMMELLTSPGDVARIAEEAAADGDGYWEEFMEEAFEDSKGEQDVDPGISACVQLGLATVSPHNASPRRAAKLNVHAFGMNLHAATTVDGRDRKQLERLSRYLLRPPFATDAIQRLPDGPVRLDIARRARSVVMSAEQFIAKLIALVPPPGVPMVRYAGVFSNRHHLRGAVAPAPTQRPGQTEPVQTRLLTFTGRPVDTKKPGPATPSKIAWAQLLARVFEVDVLTRPRPGCGGKLRATAAVLQSREIALLLHGARGPPKPSPLGQLSFLNFDA